MIRIVVIVVCLLILAQPDCHRTLLFPLSSIGYTFGGAGVKASFCGIDWTTDYGEGQTDLRPDTAFFFDPDEPHKFAPNLVGEMTNAFVPSESLRSSPSWVPTDWMKTSSYITNPIRTVTWDLPNPDAVNETIAYEVQEWVLKMYVSMTAEWDAFVFDWTAGQGESYNQRYMDTEVWIELIVNEPSWIFEGQPRTYFALGKIQCSDFAYGVLGKSEDEYTPTPKCSVTPESTSWVYLYHQKYGSGGMKTPRDIFTYQGQVLNPNIFTDDMFISLKLNNFGTEYWTSWGTVYQKGDAVTWGFDIHVFVVGEWKIKDIADLPDTYGRTPKEEVTAGPFLWLEGIINDPRFAIWSFVGFMAVILLIFAIFFPWVLFALGSFGKQAVGKGRSKS